MNVYSYYYRLSANRKLKPLVDVGLFLVLLLSFHYLYTGWGRAGFWPIGEQVQGFFNWGSRVLFEQSQWVAGLIGIDFYTRGQTFYITVRDGSLGWLEVAPGCTALKQWLHWVFLMVLYPGPWKHKAWYIPLGLLLIQLISVIRISGLALTLTFQPTMFDFYHDYVFKTMFYGVIFLMWVGWNETRNSDSKFRLE